MLKSKQLEGSDAGQEIADQIEEVGDLLVEAIKKINLSLPKVEAKFEPQIQVTVPELKQPNVDVKVTAEMPKPNPHPFANGLVCDVIKRDREGKIQQFTIKPL